MKISVQPMRVFLCKTSLKFLWIPVMCSSSFDPDTWNRVMGLYLHSKWQKFPKVGCQALGLFLGHLMQRTDSLHKTLILGKIRGRRRRGDRGRDGWMASLTQWTWVWVNSGSWWWTGRPGVLQSMGLQRVGNDWATELNWSKCALF